MAVKIIHPYGPKIKSRLTCTGTGKAKQSFKAECDINNIMAKYQKTGLLDHVQKHGAEYGFATALDFTDAMFVIAKAETMFNELPSSTRTRFDNDAAKFLDFVQNPDNLDEMQELGLAETPIPGSSPAVDRPVDATTEPTNAPEPAPSVPNPPVAGSAPA